MLSQETNSVLLLVCKVCWSKVLVKRNESDLVRQIIQWYWPRHERFTSNEHIAQSIIAENVMEYIPLYTFLPHNVFIWYGVVITLNFPPLQNEAA